MRQCVALLAGAALFVFVHGADPLSAQQGQSGNQPEAQAPAGQGRQGGAQGGRQGGGRGRQAGPPPAPAPRNAEGRVLLTGEKKGDLLWTANLGIRDIPVPAEKIPFQPWAKALWEAREKHELEPHARCKASAMLRQFLTPYGTEFVELPELKRIFIFDVGGPHTFRTIYMDGRSHPRNLAPSYYGHSIGWWEGDTLVVDSTGFNEGFWWDRRGLPHTEQLHFLERFTRLDAQNMRYEFTVNDPGAYTAPFGGTLNIRASNGTELFEYVCQQANYAHELMVGDQESVNRTTQIIP
jgi:hypothetical protein